MAEEQINGLMKQAEARMPIKELLPQGGFSDATVYKAGRSMQNGYIESFNGKFRDECLNEQWFETLHQARSAIAIWRQDYNEVRLHSSLGRIPPARFAELHRQCAGDAAQCPSTTTQID